MRTTVTFAPDVAAAVEHLKRERHIGVSEAVNELVRSGLVAQKPARKPFVQRTFDFGEMYVDVSNVEEAIEFAEGPLHR